MTVLKSGLNPKKWVKIETRARTETSMINGKLASKIAALGILILGIGAGVYAQSGGAQSLRGKLEQAIEVPSNGQLKIVSLNPTKLSTIFEVELNTGEILYTDVSGDYLFAGDMFQTTPGGLMNLSSTTRQKRALGKIENISEEEMIVFTPNDVKARITVFTDVDCFYCRKLHGDLDDLLAMGIEIRYLAYPRGGERAESFNKMISVWCSSDRKESLTLAKNDQPLPEITCDTPVLEHYAIGNELGINGTPAIVFEDGRVVPGYADSERLSAMLGLN